MQAKTILLTLALLLAPALSGCVESMDGLREGLAGQSTDDTDPGNVTDLPGAGDGNATANASEEPLEPPVARMRVFDHDGAKLFESDFVAGDGAAAGVAVVGRSVTFQADGSEAVESGASLVAHAWDFDDGDSATGTSVTHAFNPGGVYEVTLTVTDSRGTADQLNVSIAVVYDAFPGVFLVEGAEEGTEWQPGARGADAESQQAPSVAAWRAEDREDAVEGARAWRAGLPVPVDGYPPDAEATLTSPPLEIPADYVWAGWGVSFKGGSEAGYDFLTVQMRGAANASDVEAQEWKTALRLSGQQSDWVLHEDLYALTEFAGGAVQFRLLFTSDSAVEEGPGWLVDAFHLGGSTTPLHGVDSPMADDGHNHSH